MRRATSRCRSIPRACTAAGSTPTAAVAWRSSPTNDPGRPQPRVDPIRVAPGLSVWPAGAETACILQRCMPDDTMTAIGNHTIAWGDTLSQIAQRAGSTVDALMALNPDIRDANLIYAGASLRLGGADTDGGTATAVGTQRVSGREVAAQGGNAASIAQQFLGTHVGELKHSGQLPMQTWVPDNVNCANFVSACLQQAGVIDAGQGSASVDQLASNLKGDGWQTVSLQNARPGDVVLMQRDGQSHVVLFAGFENGQPRFIGSNNVNNDGTQSISWGGASGRYEIITPPR
ncbi:LysM peptidoglycan-binding domain-containing protein [Luteimonas yindakuii]|nr:LysM peptidoglycan-binding domain-containing protein [Luteimonas yindakuii]